MSFPFVSPVMDSSESDMAREIAEITAKTRDLNWDDLSTLLSFDSLLAHQKSKPILVGRLVSRKVHLKQVIFPVIRLGWRFLHDFQIEDVGPNKFLFAFASAEDKERILSQGPWNFKGSLTLLREWSPSSAMADIEMNMSLFGSKSMGFPFGGVVRENAPLIGSKIGQMLSLDDDNSNKSYLRLKIQFDADKPLQPRFSFPRTPYKRS